MRSERNGRESMSQAERRLLQERTSEVAKEYIEAERRTREEKTERLRIARIQAEKNGAQVARSPQPI